MKSIIVFYLSLFNGYLTVKITLIFKAFGLLES